MILSFILLILALFLIGWFLVKSAKMKKTGENMGEKGEQ